MLALCALAFAAACRQEGAGGAAEPGPPRVQAAALAERLQKLEARALRDPELKRMNEALGARLMDAMALADPGLSDALGRVPKLEARAAAARREGDAGGVRDARQALGAIARRFREAREAALRDPDLAAQVAVFDALLRERMLRADSSAVRLLARYERVLEQIGQQGES